jgi:hypothetical protein
MATSEQEVHDLINKLENGELNWNVVANRIS